MKKAIILISIFMFVNNAKAQNWQWAKQIGGPDIDQGGALCDDNGNCFCAGSFRISCNFQTDTVFSNGFNDIYLAKYDNSGNEIWVKKFGGGNPFGTQELPGGTVVDKINSVFYLSGDFYGTMIIDSDTVTSFNLDPFLAKFDFNGNCQWIINATSAGLQDFSSAINLDATGNIYWTAVLGANGTLDTFSLQTGTFLAKVSPAGNVLWARTEFIDANPVWLREHNNNLYFIGTTTDYTASVDTATINSNDLTDIFLCKTDTNGGVIWARRFGGIGPDYGSNLDFDNNSNMYICGTFSDTLIYNTDTISTSAFRDCFIAKLDTNGSLTWIKQIFANGFAGGLGNMVISDGDGNTYFTGYFSGSATFDTFNLSTSNTYDMFLARYDDSGDCIGVRNFGMAWGYSVQTDNNGNVYAGGIFDNSVNIGSTSLTSYGDHDVFIAKIDAFTGIGEGKFAQNNQLIIYANPNKGTFNIKVPDEIKTFKKAWLLVFDNTGKETARFSLDNESDYPHFDVASAAKGMYTVKLVQGEKSYTGKLIVE